MAGVWRPVASSEALETHPPDARSPRRSGPEAGWPGALGAPDRAADHLTPDRRRHRRLPPTRLHRPTGASRHPTPGPQTPFVGCGLLLPTPNPPKSGLGPRPRSAKTEHSAHPPGTGRSEAASESRAAWSPELTLTPELRVWAPPPPRPCSPGRGARGGAGGTRGAGAGQEAPRHKPAVTPPTRSQAPADGAGAERLGPTRASLPRPRASRAGLVGWGLPGCGGGCRARG